MSKPRVIVIGAGAAGLMAAGQAAEMGADTLLLEKMNRPARKLQITGKGRCNLTNIAPIQDFISHFGRNGRFLRQAFSRFFTADLVDFFNDQGLNTVTERGGRVFPASGKAGDVVDAMTKWIKTAGVSLKTKSAVNRLVLEDGRITGVYISTDKNRFPAGPNSKKKIHRADAVIIATGGASYPATGSTGDGYILAGSAGHRITQIRPALVPLETKYNIAKRLQGLILHNVSVTLWINDKKRASAFGELLFTGFGVSGPVILTLSKLCVDELRMKHKVSLSIDLKPALDHKKLDSRLLRDIEKHAKKPFNTILNGLLPKDLIPICNEHINIPVNKIGNQITSEERKRLRLWLKNFRLEVAGSRPFTEAIITAGGVDIKDVDPRTMESRVAKGLFFAGEILDIDADTGGYNLQAAFSTGWLAGRSAARGGYK